jgi:transposase
MTESRTYIVDELADILDRRGEDRQLEAANMLRQQQAEIETLKLRELTDEEIANVWNDVRKDATLKSSMKDIQDFARAILQKASEK